MNLQELAMDFLHGDSYNLYANDSRLSIRIFGNTVEVESIWYSKEEDKIYLHVGCKEFEGDIDIGSLSDENQERLINFFKAGLFLRRIAFCGAIHL